MNEFEQMKRIVLRTIQELEKIRKRVSRSLKKAPEGELVISASNGSKQFYQKIEGEKGKGKIEITKNFMSFEK